MNMLILLIIFVNSIILEALTPWLMAHPSFLMISFAIAEGVLLGAFCAIYLDPIIIKYRQRRRG